MNNNIGIKFQDHFKLYVLLKDKIIFESELKNKNIGFYIDLETQVLVDNNIRYFLLNSDRLAIDKILKINKIIASTETINLVDYEDVKRFNKVYFIFALIVLILSILMLLI